MTDDDRDRQRDPAPPAEEPVSGARRPKASRADSAADDGAGATLVRSSSVMAVGTVLSRVTGLLRDMALVAVLGTMVLGDAYNLANSLPNIVYILLIGGALNSVFVPQLVRHMRTDADGGTAYAQRLTTVVTLVLVVLTVLVVVAAPLIVDIYASDRWAEQDFAVAVAFARFCLPQILFYGLYTMFQQVLNARGVFGPPMFAPIVNNVVVIATCGLLLWVSRDQDRLTTQTITDGEIALLGIGTTVGIAVQALVLIPVLMRHGFRWRLRFDLRGAGLERAGGLAGWTLLYVLVNQIGYAVIVNLATTAGKIGQLEGLDYGVGLTPYAKAYLIFLLPHAVITVSVTTALLPRMSNEAAEGRLSSVAASLSQALRLIGVALVPASAFFLVLGPRIGVTLFGFGQAGVDGGRYIGLVLQAFALGLVPFCAFYVLNRGFYALEDTRTPAFVNVAVNAVNVGVGLALFAAAPTVWKTPGLAVAYGASYVVGTAIFVWLLRRRLGRLGIPQITRTYVRLIVAAAIAAGPAFLVAYLVTELMGMGTLSAALGTLTGLAVGGVVYVLLAVALRVQEATQLLGMARARLAR